MSSGDALAAGEGAGRVAGEEALMMSVGERGDFVLRVFRLTPASRFRISVDLEGRVIQTLRPRKIAIRIR